MWNFTVVWLSLVKKLDKLYEKVDGANHQVPNNHEKIVTDSKSLAADKITLVVVNDVDEIEDVKH